MLIKSDICQIESFILCKSVGQQNTEQAQYHLLNFLKIRRHKFVELSNNQVLVVSTFGTVCGTRRDRQKGNWSEKDLGRVPLPPSILPILFILPTHSDALLWFRTHWQNGTLFLQRLSFSVIVRCSSIRKISQKDLLMYLHVTDPLKSFRLLSSHLTLAEWDTFSFWKTSLSLQLSSVATTRTVAMQMRACWSDDPHFLLTQADMDISAS